MGIYFDTSFVYFLGLIFFKKKRVILPFSPSVVIYWDTGGLIIACIVCFKSSSVYSFLGKLVSWRTQRYYFSYVTGFLEVFLEGSTTKEPCGGNQPINEGSVELFNIDCSCGTKFSFVFFCSLQI